jgi:hypothetical protein
MRWGCGWAEGKRLGRLPVAGLVRVLLEILGRTLGGLAVVWEREGARLGALGLAASTSLTRELGGSIVVDLRPVILW